MARIKPFQPYRYSSEAGKIDELVTQPYDKISPKMQERYLALSPYNLVRIILGQRFDSDSATENVYTRSAKYLQDWIDRGILKKDVEPGVYGYFQQFDIPGSSESLTRKGFIALGAVEDYSGGIVHRHEQTLSGPKKDRRQLLEHTRAHFGQIFMLYPDPECRVDAILDEVAKDGATVTVTDEYGVIHSLFRISDPAKINELQSLMADKKLVIADGHHRYETALAFRDDHPELAAAQWVMMTFVNMHSPGLRILATHRVLTGLKDFDPEKFLDKAKQNFEIRRFDSIEDSETSLGTRRSGSNSYRFGGAGRESDLPARAAARRQISTSTCCTRTSSKVCSTFRPRPSVTSTTSSMFGVSKTRSIWSRRGKRNWHFCSRRQPFSKSRTRRSAAAACPRSRPISIRSS